jgi:hypothetical protein
MASKSDTIGINGNTYGIDINVNGEYWVKLNGDIIYDDKKDVMLFLHAYRMGRNHKKNEIRTALGI